MSTTQTAVVAPGRTVHVYGYPDTVGTVARQATCDCTDRDTAGGLWEVDWPHGSELPPFMHGMNLVTVD